MDKEATTNIPEPKIGDLPEENSTPSALPEDAVPKVADPAEPELVQQPDPGKN